MPQLLALIVFVLVIPKKAHALSSDLANSFDTLDPNAEYGEDGEARTVFTSNGQYFIALNATYLILYSLLFGLGVLLAFGLTSLISSIAGAGGNNASGGSGYSNFQSANYGHTYGSSHGYHKRALTIDSDLASQMFQLAEAFKKYEVKDVDCQTYVACEASQTQRHEENGILAKVVYGIMKKLNKFGLKQVERKDKYVASLLKMFQYGDESNRQGKEDACSQQRDKCYNATKKPEYKK